MTTRRTACPTAVTYYGHSAFLFRSPTGVRVLIDPYRNQCPDRFWFLREFPQVDCDLCLVTHAHFDHDAVHRITSDVSVWRMAGDLRHQDVKITGIADIHSTQRLEAARFPNVMYLLEVGGVRFLHTGDNRATWPGDVADSVGSVDVLMVTVDDSIHLLTHAEVDDLIARLRPRVVIPMHYHIEGITSQTAGLLPPDHWLESRQDLPIKRLASCDAMFQPAALPPSTEVWMFQPSANSLTAPENQPW